MRAAAVLLAFGVLTATAGSGCSGGTILGSAATDGGGTAADAGCTLVTSAYGQSCRSDSDCVAVFLGNVCDDVCHGVCANAAINIGEDARYQADLNAAPQVQISNMRTECSCAFGRAVCSVGVCSVVSGVGSPVADAGEGGASGCTSSADCTTGDFCDLQIHGGAPGVCCPGLGCAPNCPSGVGRDSRGCATCQCAPPPDGGSGGAPCTADADCSNGGVCGYAEADGCAAKGSCFPAPGAVCLAYAPGCACDGSEITVACTGLPSGYASKPLLHAGVCAEGGSSGAGGCCPTGWTLLSCTYPDGGAGMACHNPALGCASSLTCGQGCDQVVTGRCP